MDIAVTRIGNENNAERAKRLKRPTSLQETYGQVSAAINMFKQYPSLIGNMLNGSTTVQASTQQ